MTRNTIKFILSRVLLLLALALLGCVVAMQMPAVQTAIAKMAVDKLQGKLNGTIGIGALKLQLDGSVCAKDVVIIDNNPYRDSSGFFKWAPADTLARLGSVTATVRLASLFVKGPVKIGRATIEDGLFHLTSEPGKTNNLQRVFGLKRVENRPPPKDGPAILRISKVRIKNFTFRLNNFVNKKKQYSGHGINFSDLDTFVEKIEAHDFRIDGNIISGICDDAVINEKSGYRIESLQGDTRAGCGKVIVDNFHLKDKWTTLDLEVFRMLFDSHKAFQRYVWEVRMQAEFRPSIVAMKTVSYFGGKSLKDNGLVFDIKEGSFDGPVCGFSVSGLRFDELHSGTSGFVDARIGGLPNAKEMTVDSDIKEFNFDTEQLSDFLTQWARKGKVDLSRLAPGQAFRLNAVTDGPLNDLHVKGTLACSAGNAFLDVKAADLIKGHGNPIYFDAILDSQDMDLGELLGVKNLSHSSFYADAEAIIGKGRKDIAVDSLFIRSASFKGHEYKNISLAGTFVAGRLDANIDSRDPDLLMRMAATADLGKKEGNAVCKIRSTFDRVDLCALNLRKRKENAEQILAMNLYVDAVKTQKGFINGNATISGLSWDDGDEKKEIGDIYIGGSPKDGNQTYSLRSNLLQLDYSADRQPTQLMRDLQTVSTRKHLPSIHANKTTSGDHGSYRIRMDTGNLLDVMDILKPGLYIERNTQADFVLGKDGTLDIGIISGRLALGTNYLKNARIEIGNADNAINADVTADAMHFASMDFSDPKISIDAAGDSLRTSILLNGETSADLELAANLGRNGNGPLSINVRTLESALWSGNEVWRIVPSDISILGRRLAVKGFGLYNGDQSIQAGGIYGSESKDTLGVKIHNLDLSILDNFLKRPIGLEGITEGKVNLVSTEEQKLAMFINVNVDSMKVGSHQAGLLKFRSVWDQEHGRIMMRGLNELKNRSVLDLRGYYSPNNGRMFAGAKLDSLDLALVAPLLRNVFSEAGGSISGDFALEGKLDSIGISCKGAYLNDAMLRIAFTGVPYTFSGPFNADNNGIYFDKMQIRDDKDGRAYLSGGLTHKNLKNVNLDVKMSFDNLRVLNLEENSMNPFYGHLSASGNADVRGPFSALSIEGDVITSGPGDVHVPLSGSLSSASGRLLTYTDHTVRDDPYELILDEYKQKIKKVSRDLRIRSSLQVEPEVKVCLELDKNSGNMFSVLGNGLVNLDLRPSKSQVNINGGYNIDEGSYRFVIPGMLDKELGIAKGSSISFGGKLVDSRVNIKTVYKVKTHLQSLLPDETNASTRRNVECGITINDRIKNPKIGFYIDIADLEPAIKSEIDALLNTEDKIQKQFVSLLLMGSFLPAESGVFNGTNMIYSNLTEMVSSQMSNIMRKLDIPVDFGFRYEENKTGNNVFDVALSTQLFNNRVLVSGSLGNRRYKPASSAVSDVVGDIDIQIKLDKTGLYRLNLFSHSADERTNFLDYTQRNGVGFSFQKDFYTRKSRLQRNKNNVTIKIENEQGKTVSDTLSTGK